MFFRFLIKNKNGLIYVSEDKSAPIFWIPIKLKVSYDASRPSDLKCIKSPKVCSGVAIWSFL